MYGFIMACIELYAIGQNSLSDCKARIWLPVTKNFQTHPPKAVEAEPGFRKISLPPAKLCTLFPAQLCVREFWPQIYSVS